MKEKERLTTELKSNGRKPRIHTRLRQGVGPRVRTWAWPHKQLNIFDTERTVEMVFQDQLDGIEMDQR